MRELSLSGKIKTTFISAVFILSTTTVCLAADYVNVSKDGVNLRSGPGSDNEVIFELPAGYPLKVLKKDGDWLKVSDFENDRGYIHRSMTNTSGSVIVKVNGANVRSGAGTQFDKVGTVSKEVILKKVDKKGAWIKVSHPQLTGWLHSKLVWP